MVAVAVSLKVKPQAQPNTTPRYPVSHRCPFCGGSLIRRFEDGKMVCLACSREPTATPMHISLVLNELHAVRAICGQRKFEPIDVHRMRFLSVEGWSYRDIAVEVGVSAQEVCDLLHDGVKYLRCRQQVGTLSIFLACCLSVTSMGLGLLVTGLRIVLIV